MNEPHTHHRDTFETVREKDHAVFACIRSGELDVRSINDITTLDRQEINYCFEKLEDFGLIQVERSDS